MGRHAHPHPVAGVGEDDVATPKGSITFEFGPGGSQRVEVAEGEYFEVPRNMVHREGNSSPEAGEVLISRVGQGQLVFPVEGPDTA